MPANFSFTKNDEAITVPYPSFHEGSRTNFGFIDVRQRPNLIAKIQECKSSAALEAFLTRLAIAELPVFSVGCDLGTHKDTKQQKLKQSVAGGYIHFASKPHTCIDVVHWKKLFEEVAKKLNENCNNDNWKANFELAPLMLNLDHFDSLTSSVFVNFWAFDKTPKLALEARERLIAGLDHAMCGELIAKFINVDDVFDG